MGNKAPTRSGNSSPPRAARSTTTSASSAFGTTRTAGGAGNTQSLWIFDDPIERARLLSDYYDVEPFVVGAGHYGKVRIGYSRTPEHKKVAVKSVPKKRPIYVEMLRTEIAILRAFHHVNVIKLLDAFETPTEAQLVFEHCGGGDLFEPIANPGFRFTEREAARLIRQILAAVRAMHESGFVHRDLKPENIMLTSRWSMDCSVKLIDFGLATTFRRGELLTRHVGTPYYIAPEVLERRYGHECDMWAIGVITFMLLSRNVPFFGEKEEIIYSRVRRGFQQTSFDGPEWQDRSDESRDLIQRLLAMDPARRLTATEALSRPWVALEGDVPQPHSPRMIAVLRRYAHFPWLKRRGMSLIARDALQPAHKQYCEDVWRSFAPALDHKLTLEELQRAISVRGAPTTAAEAAALLQALDLDADGRVSYADLTPAIMPRLVYLDANHILLAFSALDADRDGILGLADIERALLECGGSSDDARAVLAEADRGYASIQPDGVSLADFTAVMVGNEEHSL